MAQIELPNFSMIAQGRPFLWLRTWMPFWRPLRKKVAHLFHDRASFRQTLNILVVYDTSCFARFFHDSLAGIQIPSEIKPKDTLPIYSMIGRAESKHRKILVTYAYPSVPDFSIAG